VDVSHSKEISAALRKIIADTQLWERYSKNGILNVRKQYTWQSHARDYEDAVRVLKKDATRPSLSSLKPVNPIGRRLMKLNRFLITDIDNTLIGEDNTQLEILVDLLKRNRDRLGFGVATGRTGDSARRILEKYEVPEPDIFICSVGSALFYGNSRKPGPGWASHISNRWNREKIVALLKDFEFLEYQEEETQRRFKASYYMDPGKDRLALVHNRLLQHRCRYNLIYSHDRYLDILPYRASKGKAIRYLSYKWDIPLINFLVCGDSGNDEEMLRGEPRAVVVSNYSHELASLKGSRNVYFASACCSGGIIEGIQHYRFLEETDGAD
jgi:sucrose-phosphate synthase